MQRTISANAKKEEGKKKDRIKNFGRIKTLLKQLLRHVALQLNILAHPSSLGPLRHVEDLDLIETRRRERASAFKKWHR
jgi:hypothetical protein